VHWHGRWAPPGQNLALDPRESLQRDQ